jgi:hypothetical protein
MRDPLFVLTLGRYLLFGSYVTITWGCGFVGALQDIEGGVSLHQEVANCLLFIIISGFLSLLVLELLECLPIQG